MRFCEVFVGRMMHKYGMGSIHIQCTQARTHANGNFVRRRRLERQEREIAAIAGIDLKCVVTFVS